MKIYIDGRCFSNQHQAGVARYTRYVIRKMAQLHDTKIVIVSNRRIFFDTTRLSNVELIEFHKFSILPGTFFIMFFLPFLIRNEGIFLGTNHCTPLYGRFKRVVIIHDFVYRLFPKSQTHVNRILQYISVELSIRFADQVGFVSKYTMKLFGDMYPTLLRQINNSLILSNCPEQLSFCPEALDIEQGFIFVLGSVEPRKNILSVIDAFEGINKKRRISLVIAGPAGWKNEGITERINNSKFRKSIFLPGYLSDDQIEWCYRNCSVFCFPSLYEGFGLPPFEALKSGAKVVASIKSELAYFSELPNLILFDPGYDDLADKLLLALETKKRESSDILVSDFEFQLEDLIGE